MSTVNEISSAPVKVHINNVVKTFNGRNGEMVALSSSASSAPPAAARALC